MLGMHQVSICLDFHKEWLECIECQLITHVCTFYHSQPDHALSDLLSHETYAKCQCFCLRSESWNLSAVPNLWILLVALFFVLCKKSLLCCSCLNFREDFVELEIESTSHRYFKFLIILMTLEYPFPCRKCFIKYALPMARFYELWFFTKMDYKLWLNILSKLYVLCW